MKNIIFTITSVLLFATAMFAQGSIEGTVTDAGGKGVAGVKVTISGADGKSIASVDTKADGSYTFDDIAAGKYKLVASNVDYQEPVIRDGVVVEDDDTATVDIVMGAKRVPPTPPQPAPAIRYQGVVLSFEKGSGYIEVKNSSTESGEIMIGEKIFFHVTGVIESVKPGDAVEVKLGDAVEFEVIQTKKGKNAINVKVIG